VLRQSCPCPSRGAPALVGPSREVQQAGCLLDHSTISQCSPMVGSQLHPYSRSSAGQATPRQAKPYPGQPGTPPDERHKAVGWAGELAQLQAPCAVGSFDGRHHRNTLPSWQGEGKGLLLLPALRDHGAPALAQSPWYPRRPQPTIETWTPAQHWECRCWRTSFRLQPKGAAPLKPSSCFCQGKPAVIPALLLPLLLLLARRRPPVWQWGWQADRHTAAVLPEAGRPAVLSPGAALGEAQAFQQALSTRVARWHWSFKAQHRFAALCFLLQSPRGHRLAPHRAQSKCQALPDLGHRPLRGAVLLRKLFPAALAASLQPAL